MTSKHHGALFDDEYVDENGNPVKVTAAEMFAEAEKYFDDKHKRSNSISTAVSEKSSINETNIPDKSKSPGPEASTAITSTANENIISEEPDAMDTLEPVITGEPLDNTMGEPVQITWNEPLESSDTEEITATSSTTTQADRFYGDNYDPSGDCP
jgi:hypothetical protein